MGPPAGQSLLHSLTEDNPALVFFLPLDGQWSSAVAITCKHQWFMDYGDTLRSNTASANLHSLAQPKGMIFPYGSCKKKTS